jgi:hypothetical protein
MNALIGLGAITMLVTVGVAAYMLPTLIAVVRHAPDLAAVTVINVLLGWSVFGWVLAMALAVRRAAPSIQVIGQVNGKMPVRPMTPTRSGPCRARR